MLIIHENGKIVATMSGKFTNPVAIMADIPDGKEVDYVETKTGQVILKDKAKTEAERIAELEAQMAALTGTEK